MGWQLMVNSWTNNIPLSPIQIGYVFEMLLFKFTFPFSLFPFGFYKIQPFQRAKLTKRKSGGFCRGEKLYSVMKRNGKGRRGVQR